MISVCIFFRLIIFIYLNCNKDLFYCLVFYSSITVTVRAIWIFCAINIVILYFAAIVFSCFYIWLYVYAHNTLCCPGKVFLVREGTKQLVQHDKLLWQIVAAPEYYGIADKLRVIAISGLVNVDTFMILSVYIWAIAVICGILSLTCVKANFIASRIIPKFILLVNALLKL